MKLKLRDFENVPTAGAAGTAQCKVNGAIKSQRAEITETFAELKLTAKNAANAASTIAAADLDLLLAGLLSKIRITQNDDENSVSIAPKIQRRFVAKMIGHDPATENFASGAVINASAGATVDYFLPIKLPRYVVDFETKNMLSSSGRQVNREEWFFDIPAGWNSIVLTNCTLAISGLGITLYATRLQKERNEEFCGPSIIMRTRSWTANPETENGPFFDVLAALSAVPATEDTNLVTLNVSQNGEFIGKSVTPSSLAREIITQSAPQDGVRPLDITAGTNGITPFAGVCGAIAADESEWPVVEEGQNRTLESTGVSGAVTETVAYCRVGDMYEPTTQAFIGKLLTEVKRSGLQFSQLAVKGGGAPHNGTHARWKARWLAPSTDAVKGKAA